MVPVDTTAGGLPSTCITSIPVSWTCRSTFKRLMVTTFMTPLPSFLVSNAGLNDIHAKYNQSPIPRPPQAFTSQLRTLHNYSYLILLKSQFPQAHRVWTYVHTVFVCVIVSCFRNDAVISDGLTECCRDSNICRLCRSLRVCSSSHAVRAVHSWYPINTHVHVHACGHTPIRWSC